MLKPSDETPLSAQALSLLAKRAGLPDGLLSVVTGQQSAELGAVLCSDPDVRALNFTVPTAVAQLMVQCAPTIKTLRLELDGNAPLNVFDDADLDDAVVGAIAAKFRNRGQTCVCANRIYARAKGHDAFVAKLPAVTKMQRGWRVREALKTGLISAEVAPLGGTKQSGLGREGSRHGLDDYKKTKYVCLGGSSETWPEMKRDRMAKKSPAKGTTFLRKIMRKGRNTCL